MTSETIANSGVQSIADLGATVPGLTFVNSGPSFSRVVIRGINAAGEPTVGVYYDETPVTGSIGAGNNAGGSTPELRLFDVERVEVLRGPQGTLYGSGSMGGTLRTIYKKPSYVFETALDGSLSKTEGAGDWNYEAQGMVNIPLAQDKAALRVVGFYREAAGYNGGAKAWESLRLVLAAPRERAGAGHPLDYEIRLTVFPGAPADRHFAEFWAALRAEGVENFALQEARAQGTDEVFQAMASRWDMPAWRVRWDEMAEAARGAGFENVVVR